MVDKVALAKVALSVVESAFNGDLKKILKVLLIVVISILLFLIIAVSAIVSCPLEVLKVVIFGVPADQRAIIEQYRPDLNAPFVFPINKTTYIAYNSDNELNCRIEFESDNDNIIAAQDGNVFEVTNLSVTIEHHQTKNGKDIVYYSKYNNLGEFNVKVNDEVKQGQLIGKALKNPDKKKEYNFTFQVIDQNATFINAVPYLPINPNIQN